MRSTDPRSLWRALILTVGVIALGLAGAERARPAAGQSGEGAWFLAGFPTEETTFTLLLTNPATVTQAREMLAGGTAADYLFGGTIVKAPAPWNHPWSYYLDPASVTFARAFVEVCDAHPAYVEAHLAEVGGSFLPGGYWCPWTSRLLRELTRPAPTATPSPPAICGAGQRCLFLPLVSR